MDLILSVMPDDLLDVSGERRGAGREQAMIAIQNATMTSGWDVPVLIAASQERAREIRMHLGLLGGKPVEIVGAVIGRDELARVG